MSKPYKEAKNEELGIKVQLYKLNDGYNLYIIRGDEKLIAICDIRSEDEAIHRFDQEIFEIERNNIGCLFN